MIYLPITLVFTLKTISDKTVLLNLIKDRLNDTLGESVSGDVNLVLLNKNGNESTLYRVKVDTGAYMSLLPYSAFKEISPDNYVEYTLYGIQRIRECGVECAVSKCKFKLIDDENVLSPVIEGWIAFSLGEKVPSLLGMKNILDSYTHVWDPDSNNFLLFLNEGLNFQQFFSKMDIYKDCYKKNYLGYAVIEAKKS